MYPTHVLKYGATTKSFVLNIMVETNTDIIVNYKNFSTLQYRHFLCLPVSIPKVSRFVVLSSAAGLKYDSHFHYFT